MGARTASIPTRPLGRSGLAVSALGLGTWALGGPFTFDGRDAGWGEVDDDVSIRALHTAIDAGVTLIDSAPAYGTGHSERVIGRALAQLPTPTCDEIVVATKFGVVVDEASRTGAGTDVTPAAVRAESEASTARPGPGSAHRRRTDAPPGRARLPVGPASGGDPAARDPHAGAGGGERVRAHPRPSAGGGGRADHHAAGQLTRTPLTGRCCTHVPVAVRRLQRVCRARSERAREFLRGGRRSPEGPRERTGVVDSRAARGKG